MRSNLEDQRQWRTWWWVIGYGVTYVPFAALVASLEKGYLPGQTAALGKAAQLPTTMLAWALFAFLWFALGLRKRLPPRKVRGRLLRLPSTRAAICGVATATIMITTLIAYTAQGSNPMVASLVTRASVLVLALALDLWQRFQLRAHSLAALGIALGVIALSTRWNHHFQASAYFVVALSGYVGAYALRLGLITKSIKRAPPEEKWAFFVGEHIAAAITLLIVFFGWCALSGAPSRVLRSYTIGLPLTTLCWIAAAALASELVGIFGGLVFVAPEENTYCVPANRAASVIATTIAAWVVASCVAAASGPSDQELVAAFAMVMAIFILAGGDRGGGVSKVRLHQRG